MRRTVFEAEHEQFRETVQAFLARHVLPRVLEWDAARIVDRGMFLEAGKQGLIGFAIPEAYGGPGVDDFLFNAIVDEEFSRALAAAPGLGLALQNDVVLPYFLELTTDEQKARWLPGIARGESILAIAMTEPGAGSDLAGIRTRAVRDGDAYVVDGAKTFISNGENADLVVVAVRTGEHPHRGLTLLVVERGVAGFTRSRLDKIGLHGQDTSELAFADLRIPVANRLGGEGDGFAALVANLPQERLSLALAAVAAAEGVLALTLDYVRGRTAFGQPVGSFQYNRFLLAELATELTIARVFADACLSELLAGTLTAEDAAKCKWWSTELQTRVTDRCLQLHGGYGYMREYAVGRAFLDARVQTIYGGTTEIMKEIIGRGLGL